MVCLLFLDNEFAGVWGDSLISCACTCMLASSCRHAQCLQLVGGQPGDVFFQEVVERIAAIGSCLITHYIQ